MDAKEFGCEGMKKVKGQIRPPEQAMNDQTEQTYNNTETFLLPTDAHNVKKHRVIKTF